MLLLLYFAGGGESTAATIILVGGVESNFVFTLKSIELHELFNVGIASYAQQSINCKTSQAATTIQRWRRSIIKRRKQLKLDAAASSSALRDKTIM